MVLFVCKLRLRHMCTFASENLMLKRLSPAVLNSRDRQENVWIP